MLHTLTIRNLALVVELDITFGRELNAVTGETGAGKSLILGALTLLLGERASQNVIRRGEKQCEIAAAIRFGEHYRMVRREVDALLEEAGVPPCEEDELLLRRVVTQSGSRCFVNMAPVNLRFLDQLGTLLVDIHGPHEHQSLLQPRSQLDLLDAYAGLEATVQECTGAYRQWQHSQQSLEQLRAEAVSEYEMTLLRHQFQEIERANVEPGEDTTLIERHRVSSHAKQLLEWAGQARQGLTETDGSIMDQLAPIVRILQEMQATDPEKAGAFADRIEQAVALLQEISFDLGNYADSVEVDEAELQALEDRLSTVQKLKRKYGPEIEDVLNTAKDLRARLEAVEDREERVHRQEQACRQAEKQHRVLCERLAAERRAHADELAGAICAKLQRLGFAQGRFRIDLAATDPGPHGSDRVEFCFAPNPGEDLMPLRKIASSGEIARVMLAIKTVLSAADRVPILIFDEVDANIGGRIAVKVAEELAAISARHQVLCITHLPQIAAAAQDHFEVSKQVDGERTITTMNKLSATEREAELTRMLGATERSSAAMEHAREMLGTCRASTDSVGWRHCPGETPQNGGGAASGA